VFMFCRGVSHMKSDNHNKFMANKLYKAKKDIKNHFVTTFFVFLFLDSDELEHTIQGR
jgi:hypothetical protein